MLLLDTHVFLWTLTDDPRLDPSARAAIVDARTPVLVSAASTWEMAIKSRLGKLTMPDDLLDQVATARFEHLQVTLEHGLAVSELPDHHRDPFDRMLVAQATVEQLTIVTRDPQIQRYDVPVLTA